VNDRNTLLEVKSCATGCCPTPPGPEGSNGQQIFSCDIGSLDLYRSIGHAQ